MGEINESELLFIAGFFKLRAGKHWLGAGTGLDALRHVRELLGACSLGRVTRSTPVKSWVTSQGLHHHKRHKAAWGGPSADGGGPSDRWRLQQSREGKIWRGGQRRLPGGVGMMAEH